VQDITDRVRAAESLRRSEERLRQATEVARVGIFDHDHRTGEIYWSQRQREICGYDADAPVTLSDLTRLVHPDDHPTVDAALQRAHDPAGDGTWGIEYRIVRPDGAVRSLMSRAQTTFEGAGAARRPVRTVGAAVDVTELRQADEAMRIKDEAIATSLTPIAMTDGEGRLVYVNPAFVHAWGYESEHEILGRSFTDFADAAAATTLLQSLTRQGTVRGEIVARRKDGSTFDIVLSANAVYDTHGRVTNLMGSFMDVTESKRLQAQLLQAQKMESVGRLAGGIAHDFNNLLTVIKGYADLGRVDLDPKDPLYDNFDQVSAAAESAASLTRQLLAFSRKQIIDPQALDLNVVLAGVEKMLPRLLGEDVVLRVVPGAGVGTVRFDRGQCEQILINLAVNARDAMPDGGTLTIETHRIALDESYARTHAGSQAGEYALLTVSDTGVGMDRHVKEHLFEPFFTTKGPGRGTGLGLPMVFGAVAQNGGRIEVYSEIGHGTTFKVYLPCVAEPEQSNVVAEPAGVKGGDESILLVEDDDAVRTFAAQVLRRRGYGVHAFRTGAAALKALDGLPPLHLLVTDVVMPDMNGRTMADRVLERRPGVRVLFVSGYTEHVIVNRGVLAPGVDFLAKPYSVDSLTRRVRELLDRG